MSNLARRFRELIDRGGNLGLLTPGTGLLTPGTEEDKLVRELIEKNWKAVGADPESRRRRDKSYATLQASYDRRLRAPMGVAQRQEKLIGDMRKYAASHLLEAHSQVAQLRVTRLALEFFGITPNTEQFPLSFEGTHSAIWTDGDPSLEELASKAKGGTRDVQLEQRVAVAMEIFESQPDYAKAQVWLSKRMEKVCRAADPGGTLPSGSPARAELVLRLFNVRARAYLRLVSTIETQNALVVLLDSFEILAWEEFVGGYPTSIREGAPSIDQQIGARKRHWIRKGYEQLEAHASKRGAAGMRQQDPEDGAVDPGASAGKPEFHAEHWGEVEISFFNEFSVQIKSGKIKANREFGALGMAHQRSGKPTLAWQTLHDLAQTNGIINRPTGRAITWATQEKRMQELRTWLRDQFGLSEDPLPFVKGTGYRAKFKISFARSYQR